MMDGRRGGQENGSEGVIVDDLHVGDEREGRIRLDGRDFGRCRGNGNLWNLKIHGNRRD